MNLRVARHTEHLEDLVGFYIKIIGLEFLGGFKDHSGYDGVFLGKKDWPWHLELTQTKETVIRKSDEDDLLVFYPETQAEYDSIILRIDLHNIGKVKAKNPYWVENGIMIKDPDGFGIVISPLKIM